MFYLVAIKTFVPVRLPKFFPGLQRGLPYSLERREVLEKKRVFLRACFNRQPRSSKYLIRSRSLAIDKPLRNGPMGVGVCVSLIQAAVIVLLYCAYFKLRAKVHAHNESLCDAPFAPGRLLIIDPELLCAHDAHSQLRCNLGMGKAGQEDDTAHDIPRKWLIANGKSYFVKP